MTIEPRDRQALREWFAANHESASEVWVIFSKGEIRTLSYADCVEEAICFGWIDCRAKALDETRTMRLFKPRRSNNWSALNISRVKRLTEQGLMTRAGLDKFNI